MTKSKFAIHGTAKGKNAFDVAPVAHVWAESPEEAEVLGRNITKMNPIYDTHFGDKIKANPADD